MHGLLETGKRFYENHSPPLANVVERAYTRYRKTRLSFSHYDREHDSVKKDVLKEIHKIMKFRDDYEFWLYVKKFEKAFARYHNTRYALGTHSGTSALQFSLAALGIGAGDEVITVPNTYIATALAISNSGAKPVFLDIDEETYNINTNRIEDSITDKTKAIIPVHLYGNPADMEPIMRTAKKHGLAVVEDACQAHGAQYKGKRIGSLGDAGCFSFFTNKNLSGLGNGGMIISKNKSAAEKVKALRDPESDSPNLLMSKRTPCHLDAIQVAFLEPKLKFLDRWNKARRKNAKLYNELLAGVGVITPNESKNSKHVYFSYVIKTDKRDRMRRHLLKKGVETAIEYETPIHLIRTFRHMGYKKGDFPVTEKISGEILSLPMSPFLEEEEITRVCREIKSYNLAARS
jgi:dTDP-4-amino-4,6-dideoxygalactose transaminase